MNKPLILVTNDDGIDAPGIRALIQVMNELGEVYVVAPNKAQSGMGHAVTINSTLYLDEVKIDNGPQKEWSCSGTPADCVKIAKKEILPRTPDLCVSGINHGANSGINVIYSGTMSAAIEAGIENIPAIGFSLQDFSYNADFEPAKFFAKKIVQSVLTNKPQQNLVLNVNIPYGKLETIKGIKICKQAKSTWVEEFDKRVNPIGKTYYWLSGFLKTIDDKENSDKSDLTALSENYVSVVPVSFDLTAYKTMETIKNWFN
jgi:5'-nucleotidase